MYETMEAQETFVLSDEAKEFINEMREDEGFDTLIKIMYDIMKELIQDKYLFEENNRLYLNHIVDVIDLAKMLKQ
ncbi:MAG: hypothetical protein A2W90_15245 [Bacteroidetes bacterium GWF2_42_66]|nr:MAG: hypothetical protein A2W92_23675 [Bacteroidetes bacterium GWA2_42_15]OFX96852.1 MAG: hypothetical protein A2W89_19740 [Bacteroidetes bacterium GWE2_42_39]OFY46847.1 MAG: hypothetical protein A2W90_15245 [Bacteroidetes bacterium GWF2_42_66]HBL75111.1 hypothetical protein [Prolixibacteraceae bacterium]HCU60216.1 hypothetical protein [Prolixibacteraceae bacterium]